MKSILIIILLNFLFSENHPFQHGVASGDPTSNQIIIWTRISDTIKKNISGNWYMDLDSVKSKNIRTGIFHTNDNKDFTVKIDVNNLDPNTYYYYWFEYNNLISPIGKTKTLPSAASLVDEINLCFVSCSDYTEGYFTSYKYIAQKKLDAIIHLGDYIYEYKNNVSRKGIRYVEPDKELITLQDYRARYAYYKKDLNLQKAHQMHPFIMIRDDHEIVNNFFKDGFPNMKDSLSFSKRKKDANQAYLEWNPIRENKQNHYYREINFGNLIKLLMLDTRGNFRDEVVDNWESDELNRKGRTMLGKNQKDWLIRELTKSESNWNLLTSQVIYSTVNLTFSPILLKLFGKSERLLDKWDGYANDKMELKDQLVSNDIKNVVLYSGDFHIGTINEIYYDSLYLATEFTTPSLTSYNVDEVLSPISKFLIKIFFKDHTKRLKKSNPHLKYINLYNHGYIISKINKKEITTEYYFSKNIQVDNSQEYLAKRYIVKNID